MVDGDHDVNTDAMNDVQHVSRTPVSVVGVMLDGMVLNAIQNVLTIAMTQDVLYHEELVSVVNQDIMGNIVDRNVAIVNLVYVMLKLAVAMNAKLDIITIPATYHAVTSVDQKGVLCHQESVIVVDMGCMVHIVQTNVVNVKPLHVIN